MSEIQELYRELIIDHGRHPRNFEKLEAANRIKEGYNPLCGDQLTVYLVEKDNVIADVKFQGCGCAISMASASMMTELLKDKTVEKAESVFEAFHELITKGSTSHDMEELGKLKVLAGVSQFPARVKCATLSWHTLMAAIHDDDKRVSTE